MNAVRRIATLLALVASSLSLGQHESRVAIDVSRNQVIETVKDPQQLSEAILTAVRHSQ
jgi:hypothetical protein